MWPILVAVALPAGLLWLLYLDIYRDKARYDAARDYRYPLEPDWASEWQIESGRLSLARRPPANQTLLLTLRLRSRLMGRILDPHVTLADDVHEVRYYFERGGCGVRYIDLTPFAQTLENGGDISIVAGKCEVLPQHISGFRRPSLERMRLMIIAPHPDDAEIAAFGLYDRHADRTAVVTVSPGENLGRVEGQYIPGLDDELRVAVRRRGEIRTWDAHCVPRWAGVKPDDTVMLGYFNGAFPRPQEEAKSSPILSEMAPSDFRKLNTVALPSDGETENGWSSLVEDLSYLIDLKRPDAVVTAHPELDAHPDHVAATRALEEAIEKASHKVECLLYYANHLDGTQQFPFGPAHSGTGLPPNFKALTCGQRIFSIPLDAEQQRRKICALSLMHDLVWPVRPGKQLRRNFKHFLRWGAANQYGPATYLRTAVRSSELFFYKDLRESAEADRVN